MLEQQKSDLELRQQQGGAGSWLGWSVGQETQEEDQEYMQGDKGLTEMWQPRPPRGLLDQ